MAAEYKDYYKILGIEKTADEKEVKTAYRKLARKYHPDVNPNDKTAEAKFKELNEAYEVLSDKDKRTKYDQYGDQWKAYSEGGFGGFQSRPGATVNSDFGSFGGLDDLFSSLFGGEAAAGRGGAGGFGGFRSSSRRQPTATPRGSSEIDVEISLEEAYRGTTRTFNLSLQEQCGRCHGDGAIPAGKGKPCPTCGGSGKARGGRSLFGGVCPQCGGTGEAMEACPDCHGSGAVDRRKKLSDVKIPAGVNPDQRIRLSGQGAGGGDLYLRVKIAADPRFERREDDLYTDFPIPFTVAAIGGEASVDTLEGRKRLSIPAGTQTGQSFRLTSLGMPHIKGTGKGNLYARAKITVPKDLSPRERELLMELAKLRKDEVKVGV